MLKMIQDCLIQKIIIIRNLFKRCKITPVGIVLRTKNLRLNKRKFLSLKKLVNNGFEPKNFDSHY